ncbi:DegT/DnrJ/EryC1/StrS family aminotransferase, partial [bacterium]|nr:DegT/DnrJ/EryC1/StrS family aminotransferase [bacterium]
HQKAQPVFADIDRHTLNIVPKEIERAITPRTKAIIPVHFGGLSCEMDEVEQIANQNGLVIIEDAAHAVGTRYNGKMIGGRGNLACFSFYANKNLTTAEGGMIVTEDQEQAKEITMWHLHGLSRDAWKRFRAQHLVLSEAIYSGFKYNMTDLQASLGLHQLKKQEDFLLIRERYAKIYDAAFADLLGIRQQPRPIDGINRHSLHLYVLIIDPAQFRVDRNQIVNALLAENIGASIHYLALHTHAYYRDQFGYHPDDYPNASKVGNQIFTLPLTPRMSEENVNEVIEAVYKVLTAYRV